MKESHQSYQSLRQFVLQLSQDEQKLLKEILSSDGRTSRIGFLSVEDRPLLTADELDAIMEMFKSGAT